jgi:hypothetical protein
MSTISLVQRGVCFMALIVYRVMREWVFRSIVTGRFGIVTAGFGDVTRSFLKTV